MKTSWTRDEVLAAVRLALDTYGEFVENADVAADESKAYEVAVATVEESLDSKE